MSGAGIYLHIPFCRSRCSYCDFATGMYEIILADQYVLAICAEIDGWREITEPLAVDTIYFGGGTPSLLDPSQLEKICDAIQRKFEIAPNVEVSLELNPGDSGVSAAGKPEKLCAFRRLGVNRVSFGAQTFDDLELKQLGRTHDAAEISNTFQQLRESGFDNVNFDLIAGLPGQTLRGWQRNLDQAIALKPEHLSLYLLDVHEGTPLADQIHRGMRPPPDDDLTAVMYSTMVEQLTAVGYEHYEISNFSRPGFQSRHNSKYWTGDAYYGFGCSAHSFDGRDRRWANERDTAKYVKLIETGQSLIVERQNLSTEEARAEAIFLGLRLMRGIDLENYRRRFGHRLGEEYGPELERLSEAGLVQIDERVLRLTPRGALLSNEVFAALA